MNVKLIALAVAAAVCIAGAAYLVTVDDGGPEGAIQITDGSGRTISLDAPMTETLVVGSNILQAMKILGLEDNVKGMSFSKNKNDSSFNEFSPMFPNAKKMSDYSSISSEEAAYVCGYIICPVRSMTISQDKQESFENAGVKIIRLDCNGDTVLEDFDKIAKLFGGTDGIKKNLNAYLDRYDSVVNGVKAKVSEGPDNSGRTFLYLIAGSKNAFYNQTSAGSKMAETVYGKNALRNIQGLDTSGISNDATVTNTKEAVISKCTDADLIFVRGDSNTTTADAAKKVWDNCPLPSLYSALSAIGSNSSGRIFVFNSEMMSGVLGYVGYVLLAEACGIDTGYDVPKLLQEYTDAYGFKVNMSGYMFSITITDNVATAAGISVS